MGATYNLVMGKSKRSPSAADHNVSEVQVKLKPVLGIKPGTYLTLLYACLLLAILFLIFFYPGIRRRGTFVQIETLPPGAAVLVDGIYSGSTPCEVLVNRGRRRITVTKPFYREQKFTDQFGGRIFATLFFPPRRSFRFDLKVADSEALILHSLTEFAANAHIPEIMTQTVWSVFNSEQGLKEELFNFLGYAKYFINSPYQLKEFIRTFTFLEAEAQVLTPAGIVSIVNKFIQLKENYDNFTFWLMLSLPDEVARRFSAGRWFAENYARYVAQCQERFYSEADPGVSSILPRQYRISGLSFRSVPEGTLIQGNFEENSIHLLMPHPVPVPAFLISETEVSNRLFKAFLDQNPVWRKSNLDTLLKENKVSENYLDDWADEDFPAGKGNLPVVNVSFHVAEAFCLWLDQWVEQALPGYNARLPYESEWEWAARGGLSGKPYPLGGSPADACFFQVGISGPKPVGTSSPNGYELKDMAGNVWEWCRDWYSPVKYLFSSWRADLNPVKMDKEIPLGHAKVVRGGSWANEKELIKVYTRGFQPPSWCTPYLGFRVVLFRLES